MEQYCTHLSLLGESGHSVLTKRLLGDRPAVQGDAFETGKDPPVTQLRAVWIHAWTMTVAYRCWN